MERKSSKSERRSCGCAMLFCATILSIPNCTESFVVPLESLIPFRSQAENVSSAGRLYTLWNIDDGSVSAGKESSQKRQAHQDRREEYNRKERLRKRGMATAFAAGAVVAFNVDVQPAGASVTDIPMPGEENSSNNLMAANSFSASTAIQESAVTLPYLERQIRAAEDALTQQHMTQSTLIIADATVASPASPVAALAETAPKPNAATTATASTVPLSAPSTTPATSLPATATATSSIVAPATPPATSSPKIAAPSSKTATSSPSTTTATASKVAEGTPPATSASKTVAPSLATATASPSATTSTIPSSATAGTAGNIPKPASPTIIAATTTEPTPTQTAVVTSKPAATPPTEAVSKTTGGSTEKNTSPSLYRYVIQHWPEWVDIGKMAYTTAEPLVVSVSRDVSNQFDKNVLPKIVRVEHQILGDRNADIVDKAALVATKMGKLAVIVAGKTIPIFFEAGKQLFRATPEVIKAGIQLFDTVDKKVIPELKHDYIIVKNVVEKKTSEVVQAGRQVYEAGIQLANAVEEDVVPKVMAVEKRIAPKLNEIEHRILGDNVANSIDRTVDLTLRTGRTMAKVANQNAPAAFSIGKNMVNGVVKTGRFVVDGGQQVYRVAEDVLPKAFETTKDVVVALDRTGGQVAYAIDMEAPKVAAAIKKEIPKIQETGDRLQRALEPTVIQLAESGKALTADVVQLVENVEDKEKLGSIAAAGLAATAVATAATSDDSFLLNTYGGSGATSMSDSSAGFPSLVTRSGRGGYTELSRRQFF